MSEIVRERLDLTGFSNKIAELKSAISKTIVGQEQVVDLLLASLVCDGHVLIEGVPGVAKTLLAKLMARLVDAKFSRIQFTPDLMPSDVLGTTVFNMQTSTFDFHKGPAFANIILADEINRAPAKTQAALFEVMEERQATIDGQSYKMDEIYSIFATQNPVEQEGTYKLPEAQLDRFLVKIQMNYPNIEEEVEILIRHNEKTNITKVQDIQPIITPKELLELRSLLQKIYIEPSLLRYIAAIVQQTRNSKAIYLGASPRASVGIMQLSKAIAILEGRDYITPDDIKYCAPYVLAHRILLTAEAEMEGYTSTKIIQRLVEKIEVPK